MEEFNGKIINGHFNPEEEDFIITQVRHIDTQSTISDHYLKNLKNYLESSKEGCTIAINDQIPILLDMEEISNLVDDIERIMEHLNIH